MSTTFPEFQEPELPFPDDDDDQFEEEEYYIDTEDYGWWGAGSPEEYDWWIDDRQVG